MEHRLHIALEPLDGHVVQVARQPLLVMGVVMGWAGAPVAVVHDVGRWSPSKMGWVAVGQLHVCVSPQAG